MSRFGPLVALLAVLAGMALVAVTRLDVSTDITNMMPGGTPGTLASISRQLTETELARTMILSVGADDPAHALAAAGELAERLRVHPAVAWVRAGVDEAQMQAVYELYYPRRYGFLTDRPHELPEALSDAGLAARAEALKRELASPLSPLVKRIAPADPLGAFRGIVERFQGAQPAVGLRDGRFVSEDGRWAILFLGTRPSAFDGRAQRLFLEDLRAAFEGLPAQARGPLVLESSGANRFAVEAERSIRADVQLVAVAGTLLVALLLLAVFPSPVSFLMVSLPTVAGILVAIGSGILVFGRLDGLTIGFGSALIGVVIDYPTHVLVHLALAGAGSTPQSVVRRHRAAVWLGGLTTLASFVWLGLTDFRGFREIAFFSSVGVLTALVVTLHVMPALCRVPERPPPLAAWSAGWMGASVRRMATAHRGWLWALAGACVLLALPAFGSLRWVDDLARLWRMDPALQAEDERVRARVSHADTGRFVIALAPGREEALQANDAVHDRLRDLVPHGALGGMRSLHAFLWSERLQETNRLAVRADPTLPARVAAVFEAAGFQPGAFAPFAEELARPWPPPLRYEDLLASPLADLVRSTLLPLGDGVAAITTLQDVKDEAAVRRALGDLPGVHYFDQRTFLNEIYAAFRSTTVQQVFVGNVLVILLLLVRYGRPRPALAAFLPSMLVAGVLLGSFALLGVETNLLHAVSLVMVVGMGVDYGIFVVDAAEHHESLGPTMLSICVCALTTVFTFGVMALSRHPALQAIGVTIGAGVLLSFLLAPLALLLVRGGAAPER